MKTTKATGSLEEVLTEVLFRLKEEDKKDIEQGTRIYESSSKKEYLGTIKELSEQEGDV